MNELRTATAPLTPISTAKKHILVLDDNPDICQLLATWVSAMGHVVHTKNGGKEFIRGIGRDQPDVVITDILMPNGDGFEVIEAIKSGRRGTKIIAISGGGTYLPATEYLKLARSIGADEVLLKPFTHRQIVDAVNRVLV